jgi:hypothetical protein
LSHSISSFVQLGQALAVLFDLSLGCVLILNTRHAPRKFGTALRLVFGGYQEELQAALMRLFSLVAY